MKQLLATASALIFCACSGPPPYEPVYSVASPDGKYVAKAEISEEGTLGSTRYRLIIFKSGEQTGREVFSGINADADPLKWRTSSELLVPFCFGEIESIESVLPFEGGEEIRFRNRTSSQLRIHVITSRNTVIDGGTYCPNL